MAEAEPHINGNAVKIKIPLIGAEISANGIFVIILIIQIATASSVGWLVVESRREIARENRVIIQGLKINAVILCYHLREVKETAPLCSRLTNDDDQGK